MPRLPDIVRSATHLPVFATGGPAREPYEGPGVADFTNAGFAAHHARSWGSAFALTFMPPLEVVSAWAECQDELASAESDGGPIDAPTMPMRRWTDTIQELAEGDRPVVGQVWGPLTTASARIGPDRMFSLLMRDSGEVDRLLGRETRTVQTLARAAVGAGASVVWVAEPMAVPIDPRHFEQHALGPLHKVVADVCARRRDTVIHMSGDAERLVSLVSATGALGMSITAGTDLARARDSVPPGFVLFGNLDAEELVRRDETTLGERARGMAATMTGAPYVATPGSHVPDGVPIERMAAFIDEARDHPGLARAV